MAIPGNALIGVFIIVMEGRRIGRSYEVGKEIRLELYDPVFTPAYTTTLRVNLEFGLLETTDERPLILLRKKDPRCHGFGPPSDSCYKSKRAKLRVQRVQIDWYIIFSRYMLLSIS